MHDFEIGKDKISVSDELDYTVEHKGWGSILTAETGGKMYIRGAQIEEDDFTDSLEFCIKMSPLRQNLKRKTYFIPLRYLWLILEAASVRPFGLSMLARTSAIISVIFTPASFISFQGK